MKLKIVLLLIALCIYGIQMSGQEMVTDRPDQTESSSTVAKGSLQIESGLLLGFSEENKTNMQSILAPTSLFRLGLTNRIELRVVTQYEQQYYKDKDYTQKGFGDLEVGAKVTFIKPREKRNVEMAFLTHLVLPTGTIDKTNAYGTINKLAVSHSLSKRVGIGYNLGYSYFGAGHGDFAYSLALGVGMTSKLSVYAETYGEVVNMSENQLNMDMGITYLVKENLQLDWSYGTGINHTMNYMSVGVSWNIGMKG